MIVSRKRAAYIVCVLIPFVLVCCGFYISGAIDQRDTASWTRVQKAVVVFNAALFTLGMEFYARWAHRDLWHGPSLWHIHKTHHVQERGLFEFNDVFGIANMVVVIPLMIWAFQMQPSFGSAALYGFTVGVSIYGTAYMVVHDGIHHRRFWTGPLAQVQLLKSIADAHKQHHKGAMEEPYGKHRKLGLLVCF